MNLLRLSSLFLAPALAASFSLACGEITDPTKSVERTATVSGALTGTSVPAGARVAVVWRNGLAGGVVVGAETDIVAGKFTMNLGAPPDGYFFAVTGSSYSSLSGGSPDVTAPAPVDDSSGSTPPSSGGVSSSGGAKVEQKLGTRTNVSGGLTDPLSVAIAGFVVYVDANGNGKLDLEGDHASSPDTILGGNKELLLAYLKGGGQLDYEKLRDKSGILPEVGFNLAWDEGRWLALSLVELKITDKTRLARAVCDRDGASNDTVGEATTPSGQGAKVATPVNTAMPAATDPNVHCFDNGNQFYYTQCAPTPARPVGLCSSDYGDAAPCAGISYRYDSQNPQPGWPCDITGPSGDGTSTERDAGAGGSGGAPIDGGPAPDGGS